MSVEDCRNLVKIGFMMIPIASAEIRNNIAEGTKTPTKNCLS